MIPPEHPLAPKYWMYETGGKLGPAIQRLLKSEPPQMGDLPLIRAYLRQWIDSPVWTAGGASAALETLRSQVRSLRDRQDVHKWLKQALDFGIDPL